MIVHKDISSFFDLEADVETKNWETLMKLSVDERIHKRKAIKSLILDKTFREKEENNILLKLYIDVNLSDFKEGDRVLLHKEESIDGIKATINRFEEDDNIIIEVYEPDLPSNLTTYYDLPLCLDRDLVDLRKYVYQPFLLSLPSENEFWEKLIINTKDKLPFTRKEEFENELNDTITNFELNLLPRQREAIINSMASKDYYLIQGPPGTGKSFVLSFVILEEMAYFDHKVIVIGPNHLAINNTLIQVVKSCPGYISKVFKVGQSYNAPKFITSFNGEDSIIKNYNRIDGCGASAMNASWVIGLTPHSLYTSRAKGLTCDTLIIDEAGQMTIPLALMGMIKTKKIILAGDFKQLPPIVTSDKVKDDLKKSIFQDLITKENCTMLDVSFRMCEPICNFISELFYDCELKPMKSGCGRTIINKDPLYSFDSPIIIHNVDDNGKQVSDKEAMAICKIVENYLQLNLSAKEIAVLSPFRAQAANIRRHISKNKAILNEAKNLLAIDTIDKMQGQEREVIIFSLAAGNIEYMKEMGEFLYNPNKLNVAFSRAKSKLIIIGNLRNLEIIGDSNYPHISKMLNSSYVKEV